MIIPGAITCNNHMSSRGQEVTRLIFALRVMTKEMCMKTIWALFRAISLSGVDERLDVLFFNFALISQTLLVLVDKSFL